MKPATPLPVFFWPVSVSEIVKGKIETMSHHLKETKGQAVVEFTFAFILFLTFFMSIIEFAHLLYAKVTLQYALGSSGRYMITGSTGVDGSGNNIRRDEMIRNVFCANVIAAAVRCPDIGPQFQFACVGTPCTEPGGGPDQTVVVTVNLTKPALMPFFSRFFPEGGVSFQLSTTWRNEPFSS